MKIDATIAFGLSGAAQAASLAEEAGFDGVWTAEHRRDPFLPLVLAAEHTERLQLGTVPAIAFSRNPMTVAMLAHELQLYARGRFVLGLGSLPKAHVVGRFSMPWSAPAPRMREFVLALRAIWDCWDTVSPLDFRGEFYTHTVMSPLHDPGPNPYGAPRICIVAADAAMAEVAGEVADLLVVPPLTTGRQLAAVIQPALARGLARSGRTAADVEVSAPAVIVTAPSEHEIARAAATARLHIAQRLRLGLDDETFADLAVVGAPDDVGRQLFERYDAAVTRITLDTPYAADPLGWREVNDGIRQGYAAARDRAALPVVASGLVSDVRG